MFQCSAKAVRAEGTMWFLWAQSLHGMGFNSSSIHNHRMYFNFTSRPSIEAVFIGSNPVEFSITSVYLGRCSSQQTMCDVCRCHERHLNITMAAWYQVTSLERFCLIYAIIRHRDVDSLHPWLGDPHPHDHRGKALVRSSCVQ